MAVRQLLGGRRGGLDSYGTFQVDLEDVDEFVADLRLQARETARLPSGRFGKQARLPVELAKAYEEAADLVVREARSLGESHGPMLGKAARSIRVINASGQTIITAGGDRKGVFSGGGSYTDVFFGADFGSIRFKQFPQVRRKGRTIYPAWDNKAREVDRLLGDAFDNWFKSKQQ